MANTKKYWQSIDHLQGDSNFLKKAEKEFAEPIPVEQFLGNEKLDTSSTSRRDFLKFMGFSVAAATLAACETPVIKSIPYVVKPEEITPGVANYYASTYADGVDYCSILVKTREGRPILIEGNKLSPVTKGAVNARVNSSVLSLYDSKRLKSPKMAGSNASWDAVDKEVSSKLEAAKAKGGKVVLVSNSIISPSTKAIIAQFGANLTSAETGASFQHVTYDAVSYSGLIQANEISYGKKVISSYHFDKAKVIVSVGADFLSTWLSPIEFSTQYGQNRNPNNAWMSQHYQFEANMSLSGSNADVRGAVKASDYAAVVAEIYNQLAKGTDFPTVKGAGISSDDNGVAEKITAAVKALKASKGESLVVCGSNNPYVQVLVNNINAILENTGKTVDVTKGSYIRQGIDAEYNAAVAEMSAGKVAAVIVYGCDPVYSSPKFAEAIAKVPFKVSFDLTDTATALACDVVCPDNHYLESWNDANPKAGEYSLGQPTISKLFDTRQAQDSLLKWSGSASDYYAFMRSYWSNNIFNQQSAETNFDYFWNKALHDGVLSMPVAEETLTFNNGVDAIAGNYPKESAGGVELVLYMKTSMGEGNQANNPWLQELPDPITKVVWDNYITMNPTEMGTTYNAKTAQESPADMATVSVNGVSVTLPVVASPGQKTGTIGIALGYGKGMVGETLIGQNAFGFVTADKSGNASYAISGVSIENANQKYAIASTQTHHTMMGRKIVNEISMAEFKSQPREVWNPLTTLADSYGNEKHVSDLDLWDAHPIDKGHRWGMSIDLNSCIGCGACVTACHAENNVPVVGKDEVRRTRTMSWMRIDRYYSSDADPKGHGHGVEKHYSEMEVPSAYPQVVYQPVMCQHCNHAPCETVCPVAATTHSNEGLNQMTYNRCIGTRYCANNCPYKVRRFNWFNYVGNDMFSDFNPSQDDLGRMVLNPDVVVRSRGVMEKCTLCVQRIQAGKLEAKKMGRPVQDGEISTACSASCPTHAIKFGDINDKNTVVSKETNDARAYNLLEEVGVKPNIWYQTKVRNVEEHTA